MFRQILDGNDRQRWGEKDRGGQSRVLIFILHSANEKEEWHRRPRVAWCRVAGQKLPPRSTAEGTRCPGGTWHLNHNGWDNNDNPTLPSQPRAPQAAWVSLSALIPVGDELCMGQRGAHLSCWAVTETGDSGGLPAPSQRQAGVQKGQRHESCPCLPSSFSWLRTTLVP